MSFDKTRENSLRLKLGENLLTVFYRRPEAGRLIETLVNKLPSGDERRDAERALLANLELGRECVTGIELSGEAAVEVEDYPLVLIALGQQLSQPPSFVEEGNQKKTCASPLRSCGEN